MVTQACIPDHIWESSDKTGMTSSSIHFTQDRKCPRWHLKVSWSIKLCWQDLDIIREISTVGRELPPPKVHIRLMVD